MLRPGENAFEGWGVYNLSTQSIGTHLSGFLGRCGVRSVRGRVSPVKLEYLGIVGALRVVELQHHGTRGILGDLGATPGALIGQCWSDTARNPDSAPPPTVHRIQRVVIVARHRSRRLEVGTLPGHPPLIRNEIQFDFRKSDSGVVQRHCVRGDTGRQLQGKRICIFAETRREQVWSAMPLFVAVTDPEKAASEQANDPSMAKHRFPSTLSPPCSCQY